MIVDAKNGYIITNAHVIENADEITVTLLDNRSLKAKVIGKDTGSDVAVLQGQVDESRGHPHRRLAIAPRSAISWSRSATRSDSATR